MAKVQSDIRPNGSFYRRSIELLQSTNMALIKLSLIKVSLILLARLIDLICLSSTIGCDLYLVNELIDLAQVYLEASKSILTCCPFNPAYSGHSLGHYGNVLAKVCGDGGVNSCGSQLPLHKATRTG